jgi:hypothetical protein
MRDRDLKPFSFGVIFGIILNAFVYHAFLKEHLETPCPQLPIDNELIYVNDSTYHRIHVRIDTTLYYADKPQAIEITH